MGRPDKICNSEFTFSIIISTYNRAYILQRALESITNQSISDFEVIIVDDGSTDDTRSMVCRWADRVDFPVRYIWQPNQGRHVAYNEAFKVANGYFSVILDSDDMLSPDALSIFLNHWDQIPDDEKEHFAGVEGLCADIEISKISGECFPEDVFSSNYLETRKKYKIGGEKKRSIRTEIHRAFPFPTFSDEKYMRPSIVWNRIAHRYRFRYVNEVVQLIEYQTDGLNNKRSLLRVQNPHGFRLYFQEEITLHSAYNSFADILRFYSKYIRYSIHAGISFKEQRGGIPNKTIWSLCLLPGISGWFRDSLRMKWYQKRKKMIKWKADTPGLS